MATLRQWENSDTKAVFHPVDGSLWVRTGICVAQAWGCGKSSRFMGSKQSVQRRLNSGMEVTSGIVHLNRVALAFVIQVRFHPTATTFWRPSFLSQLKIQLLIAQTWEPQLRFICPFKEIFIICHN